MHFSSTDNPHTIFQNITNVDNLKRNPTKLLIRQSNKVKALPTRENRSFKVDCRPRSELGLIPATVPTKAAPTENVKMRLSTGTSWAFACQKLLLKINSPYVHKLFHLGSLNPDIPWRRGKVQHSCVPLPPRPVTLRDNSKVDTHLRGLLHSSPPSGTCGSRSVAQGDVTAPGMLPLAGLLPQGSLSSCGITLPSVPGPSRWCHHSSKGAVMEGESCLHCCQKQRVTGLHNPPATIFFVFSS